MVSIRTPRAGRDFVSFAVVYDFLLFLSARPGRGATSDLEGMAEKAIVSIRTPRAGRDTFGHGVCFANILFLSARPGRGATFSWPG